MRVMASPAVCSIIHETDLHCVLPFILFTKATVLHDQDGASLWAHEPHRSTVDLNTPRGTPAKLSVGPTAAVVALKRARTDTSVASPQSLGSHTLLAPHQVNCVHDTVACLDVGLLQRNWVVSPAVNQRLATAHNATPGSRVADNLAST